MHTNNTSINTDTMPPPGSEAMEWLDKGGSGKTTISQRMAIRRKIEEWQEDMSIELEALPTATRDFRSLRRSQQPKDLY